jgi:hypothetical protein
MYTRNMLHGYSRQLLAARHLRAVRATAGLEPALCADAKDAPPRARRRIMVERVARELFDSLVFTGGDNEILKEVRQELSATLGDGICFYYPPGQVDLCIARTGADGQTNSLPSEEKNRLLNRVWDIILRKVDATML